LSYFLNISTVIEDLSKKYSVGLFVEKNNTELVRLELSKYFPNCEVVDVNYRLLPYFQCGVHLSSIAGKENYFSKASQRVFYFHGTANLAGFKKNGLRAYDIILCATQNQFLEVSLVYASKIARLVGYPKLSPNSLSDAMSPPKSKITVIYCPSYRKILNYGQLLQLFDHEIILESILRNECVERIIFRPHPQDVIDGNLDELLHKFDTNFKVEVDYTADYHAIYMAADVLVTDFSGTAVSFSLIYGKPSICVLRTSTLLEEIQPYAMEVCKVLFQVTDLENSDRINRSLSSSENNILEIRKLHLNAKVNFVLAVEEFLDVV
jgi:hypothetical protein